jgi:hypothetical protein
MQRAIKEYGKVCQSCFSKVISRTYFRPSLGFKGKQANKLIWRRLCQNCWERANENQWRGWTSKKPQEIHDFITFEYCNNIVCINKASER